MKTVVIIDNNEELVKQVTILLKETKGIEVLGTATNGEEGLILVRRTRPDIVITDIKMPEMNGTELIRYIVSDKMNYLPHFIVMTTQETSTIVELRELPVRRIFNKPFAIKELIDEVVKIQEDEKVRVIIADDDIEFCQKLKSDLDQYEDIEVLGIANNDEEEISLIEKIKPDIVITDLLRNGKITPEQIIEQFKSQKFLVVSYSPYATPETRENVVWSMHKDEIKNNITKLVFKLKKVKADMVRLKPEDTINITKEKQQEKGIWEIIKNFFTK